MATVTIDALSIAEIQAISDQQKADLIADNDVTQAAIAPLQAEHDATQAAIAAKPVGGDATNANVNAQHTATQTAVTDARDNINSNIDAEHVATRAAVNALAGGSAGPFCDIVGDGDYYAIIGSGTTVSFYYSSSSGAWSVSGSFTVSGTILSVAITGTNDHKAVVRTTTGTYFYYSSGPNPWGANGTF